MCKALDFTNDAFEGLPKYADWLDAMEIFVEFTIKRDRNDETSPIRNIFIFMPPSVKSHMSGATDFIDYIFLETEKMDVLAKDGTSLAGALPLVALWL